LTSALDAAPSGLSATVDGCGEGPPGDWLDARFSYPNGKSLWVAFRLEGCSHLGATSGGLSSKEAAAWVFALIQAAHYPGSFADPGRTH
jgi:hypothetical protein